MRADAKSALVVRHDRAGLYTRKRVWPDTSVSWRANQSHDCPHSG